MIIDPSGFTKKGGLSRPGFNDFYFCPSGNVSGAGAVNIIYKRRLLLKSEKQDKFRLQLFL